MKQSKYVIGLFCTTFIVFTSCKKDILNLKPLDRIGEAQYWKHSNDAMLYVNNFYNDLSVLGGNDEHDIPYGDRFDTDNAFPINFSMKLAGTRTVGSSGGEWSFSNIREINYFLENYNKIEDAFDSYKQYVGEGYFFRAYFYFDLVKIFGDVPYVDKTLNMDSEELYNPRTPRQQVIDFIIADLNKAIEYMSSGAVEGGTRLNKEVARLFKSRVCLYEGTWEKYHNGTVFGVSNPKFNEYFEMAANTAKDLIESNVYGVYNTGDPGSDYFNLFNQINYSGHREIMLWKKFDGNLGMIHRHEALVTFGGDGGMTKNLVDDYLCIDGLPKAVSTYYKGDDAIGNVLTNRDPRLSQTVWGPGEPVIMMGTDTLFVWTKAPLSGTSGGLQRNIGGYHVKKRANIHGEIYFDYGTFTQSVVGSPIFRFAEALLNYAEAKAELGSLSQTDLDISINILRDRVGMPHLMVSNIINDPDWIFPDLSPVINEIRRERRVELALEDFRWDDLARWRAHKVFTGKRFYGAPWEPNRYPELKVGTDVFVTNDGRYIDPFQKALPDGNHFDPDRDYLDPIATEHLSLNPNLVQNPGW